MKPFLSFQGSRACPPKADWFFERLIYEEILPPPHSLRQDQGCGFPHTLEDYILWLRQSRGSAH
jgi:hypothetical protein